jgi:hypothetical protein
MTSLPGPALATRANREGDPCPAWCTTDHNYAIDGTDLVRRLSPRGETGKVALSGGHRDDRVSAGAAQPTITDPGTITVMVSRHGLKTLIMQRDQAGAGELAALLEQLADAAPAQLMRIAAGVRAAADLTAPHGTSEAAGPAGGNVS